MSRKKRRKRDKLKKLAARQVCHTDLAVVFADPTSKILVRASSVKSIDHVQPSELLLNVTTSAVAPLSVSGNVTLNRMQKHMALDSIIVQWPDYEGVNTARDFGRT